MAYLLDANVFSQAKNLHYGLDFCPAFWEWLIANNAAGKVYSVEKVGDEIAAGADELAAWYDKIKDVLFVKPDSAILPALGTVSAWRVVRRMSPWLSTHFCKSQITI
jgi:hypothetical protein